MIAHIKKPMTYFIVGFGRGGTTILANAMNSLQNGFCIGEPYHHHSDHSTRSGPDWTACGGKVEHLLQGNEPLDAIWGVLGDEYLLGGYKETVEPVSDWVETVLPSHMWEVDFYIVILRDPVLVHSSQRALGWKLRSDEPAAYLEDYKLLAELANTYPGIPLTLEDLIGWGGEYLNERLPIQMVGDLELTPTNHNYGDPAANRSTSFRRPDRKINLTTHEVAQHEEARRIWASFRIRPERAFDRRIGQTI